MLNDTLKQRVSQARLRAEAHHLVQIAVAKPSCSGSRGSKATVNTSSLWKVVELAFSSLNQAKLAQYALNRFDKTG
jgi:hypothetical protein